MRNQHKRLKKQIDEKGAFCHWCKRPIVMVRYIPTDKIVRLTSRKVWYRSSTEEVVVSAVATLDHVVSRGLGGSNAPDNTVPSCFGCNNARADSDNGRNRTKRQCALCSEFKIIRKRKKVCMQCWHRRRKEKLFLCWGWSWDEGHGRWSHPRNGLYNSYSGIMRIIKSERRRREKTKEGA